MTTSPEAVQPEPDKTPKLSPEQAVRQLYASLDPQAQSRLSQVIDATLAKLGDTAPAALVGPIPPLVEADDGSFDHVVTFAFGPTAAEQEQRQQDIAHAVEGLSMTDQPTTLMNSARTLVELGVSKDPNIAPEIEKAKAVITQDPQIQTQISGIVMERMNSGEADPEILTKLTPGVLSDLELTIKAAQLLGLDPGAQLQIINEQGKYAFSAAIYDQAVEVLIPKYEQSNRQDKQTEELIGRLVDLAIPLRDPENPNFEALKQVRLSVQEPSASSRVDRSSVEQEDQSRIATIDVEDILNANSRSTIGTQMYPLSEAGRIDLMNILKQIDGPDVSDYLKQNPMAALILKRTGIATDNYEAIRAVIDQTREGISNEQALAYFDQYPLAALTIPRDELQYYPDRLSSLITKFISSLGPEQIRSALEANPFLVLTLQCGSSVGVGSSLPADSQRVIRQAGQSLVPDDVREYLQKHPQDFLNMDPFMITQAYGEGTVGTFFLGDEVRTVVAEEASKLRFKARLLDRSNPPAAPLPAAAVQAGQLPDTTEPALATADIRPSLDSLRRDAAGLARDQINQLVHEQADIIAELIREGRFRPEQITQINLPLTEFGYRGQVQTYQTSEQLAQAIHERPGSLPFNRSDLCPLAIATSAQAYKILENIFKSYSSEGAGVFANVARRASGGFDLSTLSSLVQQLLQHPTSRLDFSRGTGFIGMGKGPGTKRNREAAITQLTEVVNLLNIAEKSTGAFQLLDGSRDLESNSSSNRYNPNAVRQLLEGQRDYIPGLDVQASTRIDFIFHQITQNTNRPIEDSINGMLNASGPGIVMDNRELLALACEALDRARQELTEYYPDMVSHPNMSILELRARARDINHDSLHLFTPTLPADLARNPNVNLERGNISNNIGRTLNIVQAAMNIYQERVADPFLDQAKAVSAKLIGKGLAAEEIAGYLEYKLKIGSTQALRLAQQVNVEASTQQAVEGTALPLITDTLYAQGFSESTTVAAQDSPIVVQKELDRGIGSLHRISFAEYKPNSHFPKGLGRWSGTSQSQLPTKPGQWVIEPAAGANIVLKQAGPSDNHVNQLNTERVLLSDLNFSFPRAAFSRPEELYGFGVGEDGRPYLVLEEVAVGENQFRSLSSHTGKPMTEVEALELSLGVATIFAEAHQRGIVYVDLNSGNYFWNQNRKQGRLIDWELSRPPSRDSDRRGFSDDCSSLGKMIGALLIGKQFDATSVIRNMPAEINSVNASDLTKQIIQRAETVVSDEKNSYLVDTPETSVRMLLDLFVAYSAAIGEPLDPQIAQYQKDLEKAQLYVAASTRAIDSDNPPADPDLKDAWQELHEKAQMTRVITLNAKVPLLQAQARGYYNGVIDELYENLRPAVQTLMQLRAA